MPGLCWRSRHGLSPTLVIVGGKGWFYEQLDARVRTLGLTDIGALCRLCPG